MNIVVKPTIFFSRHGVVLVKIDDPAYAASHGIDATPKLVYFENEVPNIFAGDLSNEDEARDSQINLCSFTSTTVHASVSYA